MLLSRKIDNETNIVIDYLSFTGNNDLNWFFNYLRAICERYDRLRGRILVDNPSKEAEMKYMDIVNILNAKINCDFNKPDTDFTVEITFEELQYLLYIYMLFAESEQDIFEISQKINICQEKE